MGSYSKLIIVGLMRVGLILTLQKKKLNNEIKIWEMFDNQQPCVQNLHTKL